jgi:hypothetical protein
MRVPEAFCGMRVLDYVVMANHFHLVREVPEPKPFVAERSDRAERSPLRPRNLRAAGSVRFLRFQIQQFARRQGTTRLSGAALRPSILEGPRYGLFIPSMRIAIP